MKLASLPVELILKIFTVLDWRSLVVCRKVCRLFQSIIEDSTRAQYDIELAVSGMMDGPASPLTAADRMALLKEYNAAWESLRWKESNDMPKQQGHIWELSGGVFAQSSSSNFLHFHRLPSKCRNIEEEIWCVALDIDVRDFTMDPGQDLLVVIEKPPLPEMEPQIRIHLRSLTTGDKHRLALQLPILIHDFDLQEVSYTLQVCGNLLGVHCMSPVVPVSGLTVWNWTTGQLILTRTCPEITTFAFLNSRFLLVGSNIDIETTDPHLYVLDMAHPCDEKTLLTTDYFCAFAWPQFSPWSSLVSFSIRSDPSPAWEPNPKAQLPFSVAHQHRLFVITSWVVTVDGHEPSYDLFVSADTLLSHIEALSTLQHKISWDEWGPTGTRLLPSPFPPSPWVCYVFGTRFATFDSPRTRLCLDTLEVRDFNQLAMKRIAGSSKDFVPGDEIAQHVYESTVVKAGVFKNDVRTSLPYRFTSRTLPRPFAQPPLRAAMCSEDNLILVDQNSRHFRVLTF